MTVTPPTARDVLRVDAGGEGVLTLGVIALAYCLPTGGGWGVPPRLGRPGLVVIAVLLAVAAGALAWLAEHHDPVAVRAIAGANAVTAVVLLCWAAFDGDTGAWLRTATAVVALALISLAGVQLRVSQTS